MEELKKGISWKEAIDTLNNSGVLEVKIVERRIKKRKRKGEDLKDNTLFVKKLDSDYKTVYRKNLKEEKDTFLEREVNINVIDYLNSNLLSASTK
jgi:thermostable 8-oxoguanine DNA glycosylase